MATLALRRTLPYGDVDLLVAVDAEDRCFLGVALSRGQRGNAVFVEVAPETVQQLEEGRLSLHSALCDKGKGLVIEMPRQAVLEGSVALP